MIKTRNASEKDTGAILELLVELGRPTPINKSQKTRFEKMINSYISDKDKILLVACDDNKVIGIASVVLMDRLNQVTKEMYIPELIVSAKYRGMGIGKRLINHCVRIANSNNCFRIRLESGYSRTSSHKFYRKIGFEDYAITFKKILS